MITTEVEELNDLNMAKEVAETLNEHYPGHLWAVNIRGGIVLIKNLYISDKYGMVIHYKNMGDAGVRKKKIIRAGGEFLERARMKRGKYEGYAVGKVDGIR